MTRKKATPEQQALEAGRGCGMTPFTFHTDPGHGWLEVPAADVRALGVKVSRYSYRSRDGRTVYLEEDCDAPAFVEVWTAKHGQRPEYREQDHANSAPCRALPHVSAWDFPG